MKKSLKKILPTAIVHVIKNTNRALLNWRNKQKSNEAVFTDIYMTNKWGGTRGEFCSGSGSTDRMAVDSYVAAVSQFLLEEKLQNGTFVDLGCGDFRVGKGLSRICKRYIGVDVVGSLVDRNNRLYGSDTISFSRLDIVHDQLPIGDVCFIRQVLQHLSNREIAIILGKLSVFRHIIISEHYPDPTRSIVPNIDKVHGDDIRATKDSAVYLNEPPFLIPDRKLKCILDVRLTHASTPGSIKTIVYQPWK